MKHLFGLVVLFAAPAAFAHPGHEAAGFATGVWHPLTGMDHLLALIAAGLWGAQLGGRARVAVPVSFLAAMAGGLVAARMGLLTSAFEPGLAGSVLVFGLLIASATWLPATLGAGLVGGFALLHGAAHGIELPRDAGSFGAALGLLVASAAVLGAAANIDRLMPRAGRYLRPLGAGITAGGVFLVAGL